MAKGNQSESIYVYGFCSDHPKDSHEPSLRKAYDLDWIEVPRGTLREAYSRIKSGSDALLSSVPDRSSPAKSRVDAQVRGCIVRLITQGDDCTELVVVSDQRSREARKAAKRLGLEKFCPENATRTTPKVRIL